MRLLVAYLCAFFALGLVSKTTCMTNREFAELMQQSADDIQETLHGDDDIDDDDNEDVIKLPGGPDDEVDFPALLGKTELPEEMFSKLGSVSSPKRKRKNLGWWWSREKKSLPHDCSCKTKTCFCCRKHTFVVNLVVSTVKYKLTVCGDIVFLNHHVDIKFTLQGLTVYHNTVNLRRPPKPCHSVPYYHKLGKVCLAFYNVHCNKKSFCLKATGKLAFGCKRYILNLKVGCFVMPYLTEEKFKHLLGTDNSELTKTLSDPNNMDIERSDGDIFSADVQTLPQLKQFLTITEITEDPDDSEADGLGEDMEIGSEVTPC